MACRFLSGLTIFLFIISMLFPVLADDADSARRPYRVTIRDDKPVVVEARLPVDPGQHITYQFGTPMAFGLQVDGKRLNFAPNGGIMTQFKMDGMIVQPGQGPGRLELNRGPLPPDRGRKRIGERAIYVHNNVRITQTVEVVAGNPGPKLVAGQKAHWNVVLVHYTLENKDTQPHKVAMRVFMDMLLVDNDGALFAAPNFPDKILDGVELKGKQVPDYLKVLQHPDLKNPGYVAHFTYNLGRGLTRPDRVVLTSLQAFAGPWDLQAIQAMGDSAMAMYWDERALAPGSKQEWAYAYGEGIAQKIDSDSRLALTLGGSFEPGKTFNVSAYVDDALPGQCLTLELPPGMERIDGKALQPVPPATQEGKSIVLWKGRVLRAGDYALRVRSSTGVTQTKLITVSRSEK
jgi:hypothetical protein